MASFATNESNYDNLLVGGKEFTTKRGVLLSGQDVVRGEALGKITSGGKLRTWGSGGSQWVRAIAMRFVRNKVE